MRGVIVVTGVEVPVLPGSRWSDDVDHFQHVDDPARLPSTADGLPDLRTASFPLHTSAGFHTHDQGPCLSCAAFLSVTRPFFTATFADLAAARMKFVEFSVRNVCSGVFHTLFYLKPHRSTAYVDAACCYRRSSVVGRS